MSSLTSLDKLLIVTLIIIALAGFIFIGYFSEEADTAIVNVDGKEALRLPLNKNRIFSVEGPLGITDIEIKDGSIRVINSVCDKKICVKTGWIHKSYQHILCVPNHIAIYLSGGGKREKIDGITE